MGIGLIGQGPHGAKLRGKSALPCQFRQQGRFFPRRFKPQAIACIGRLIQTLAQGLADCLHEWLPLIRGGFTAPCNSLRRHGWYPMGRNRPGLAHILSAHPSGNSQHPHGWCRKGKTRSAPRQNQRRKKIGSNPIPHGWNPMGRTRCVLAPFAARMRRWWRAITQTGQRAAASWAILPGPEIRKAVHHSETMWGLAQMYSVTPHEAL